VIKMHPNRSEADKSKADKLSRMYADGGTVDFKDKLKSAIDGVVRSTEIMGDGLSNTSKAVNTELAKPNKSEK